MLATQVFDYFRTLVADDDSFPLTEAVLAIAQDAYPALDLQDTLIEIDKLTLKVRAHMPADAGVCQRVSILNRCFFRELGFAVNRNDYHDPDNSHLNVVIGRRRGAAVSLAVLYLEIASQLALPVRGVSFPGRFLLRATVPEGEVMIDPATGRALSEADMVEILEPYLTQKDSSVTHAMHMLLEPTSRREIVARLLRELKAVYLQTECWQRVLAVQQRLVILLPECAGEVRDRGFAYARLAQQQALSSGYSGADFRYRHLAREDLEHYLQTWPQASDAQIVEMQLHALGQHGYEADGAQS